MSMTLEKPPSISKVLSERKKVRNVNMEHKEKLSVMERMAVFISDRVGTPGFFFLIIFWTTVWLLWNFFAPAKLKFDPPMAFVFWLFISNVLQIFLMPLIMVAQNLQSRHSELRAENDFDINVKAEREIEVILRHLEYQNTMLLTMVQKLGGNVDEAVKAIDGETAKE